MYSNNIKSLSVELKNQRFDLQDITTIDLNSIGYIDATIDIRCSHKALYSILGYINHMIKSDKSMSDIHSSELNKKILDEEITDDDYQYTEKGYDPSSK